MKILSLILIMFCATAISAQNIASKNAKVSYIQLPTNPLPEAYTTYSANFRNTTNEVWEAGITESSLMSSYVDFRGLKQVGQGGHLQVNVLLGSPVLNMSSTKTRQTSKKNKDGTTTTTTYYYRDGKFYMPISYQIVGNDGAIIKEQVVASSSTTENVKFDNRYRSSTQLRNAYREEYRNLRNNLIRKHISKHMGRMKNSIMSALDTRPASRNTDVMYIKTKKHKEYDALLAAMERTKEEFGKMSATESVETIKKELAPSIEYWERLIGSYSATEKKTRKIHWVARYNLANVHFWLDDLDKASTYAAKLTDISLRKPASKSLQRRIEDTKKLFQVNEKSSRHFAVDLSNASAPVDPNAGAQVSNDNSPNIYEGMVEYASGKIEKGKFYYEPGVSSDFVFGNKGNVRFKAEGSTGIGRVLSPSKVRQMKIGEREISILRFSPTGTIKTNQFVEKLFASSKIEVYMFYPTHNDTRVDWEPAPLLYNIGTDKWLNTGGLKFALSPKKALAKFFKDCPKLSEQCSNENLLNTYSARDLAEHYTEECK